MRKWLARKEFGLSSKVIHIVFKFNLLHNNKKIIRVFKTLWGNFSLAGLRRAKVVEELKINFGVHLTIDGYRGDKQKLNSFEVVFNVLDKLPGELGMGKLTTPYVVIAPPVTEKDQGGFSGFVIIAESHISIHTFPQRRFVSADVYTCKNDMNAEKIINYFKNAFGLEDVEINFVVRGKKFLEQ